MYRVFGEGDTRSGESDKASNTPFEHNLNFLNPVNALQFKKVNSVDRGKTGNEIQTETTVVSICISYEKYK